MKKSKLSLEELKVESFVLNTDADQQTVVGGSPVTVTTVTPATSNIVASVGASIGFAISWRFC